MRTTCRTMGTRTALEKMKALLQQLKSDVDHQSVVATVPFSPLGLNCRTFHPAFFLPPLSFLASIHVTCALDDTFRSQMVPNIHSGSKGHRLQVRLEKRLYYAPCDVPFDVITKTQALRCRRSVKEV